MSRKAARENAFRLIFELPFHTECDFDKVWDVFSESEAFLKLTEADTEYIIKTVTDCFDNIEKIDEQISASLKNWTIGRISKVNLSIMRLSLSEINYGDIPYRISINEAIELAKKFSDDDAPSFVNGVLADVIAKK